MEALYNNENIVKVLLELYKTSKNKNCLNIIANEQIHSYSYESLIENSLKAAQFISTQTEEGDRVVLSIGTSTEFVEFFFGCIFSKRIAVPLPVEKATSRFSRINNVIEDCEPSLILFKNFLDKKKANVSSNAKQLVIEDLVVSDDLYTIKSDEIKSLTIAFIQYTSGSTSAPKGVAVTHENLIENLRMIQQGMEITPADTIMSWLPLHHDMGLVGMLLTPVVCGASSFIYPYQEFVRSPLSWLTNMERYKCTLSGAPTFAFDLVNKKIKAKGTYNFNLSNMRLLFCGSERINPKSIVEFYRNFESSELSPKSFFPCYGLAESTLYVSGSLIDISRLSDSTESVPTCGKISNGLKVDVFSDGKLLPPNSIGEICLTGKSITPGYWAQIKFDVVKGNLNRTFSSYMATGDLGYISRQELYLTGRIKDMIKVRGRSVAPEDIENLIEEDNRWVASNSAVAISIFRDEYEELAVVVEIDKNNKDSYEELYLASQKKLSSLNLKCDRFIVLKPYNLPKTSSGKKQRAMTKKKLINGDLEILWDSKHLEEATPDSSEIFESHLESVKDLKKHYLRINRLLADERRSYPADFSRYLAETRMFDLLIPKNYGGRNLSNFQFAQLGVGLGEIDLTLGSMIGNHNTIGVLPILHSDVFTNKDLVLSDISKNSKFAAFALTESDAGSNPRLLKSQITHVNGSMLLSGEKIWIGNAQFASYITVFARETSRNGSDLGISAFLLNRDKHNYKISAEQMTLGLKAMPQNRVILDSVKLEDSDRLSKPGRGLDLAFKCMEYARFGLAALSLGGIKKAISISSSYINNREIWTGRMIENAFVKAQMSKNEIYGKALHSLVFTTATEMDKTDKLPMVLSMSCKILAGEWTFEIIDSCLQLCGGRGYLENFGLSQLLRDSRVVRIFEGPTEALAYQLGAIVSRSSDSIFDSVVVSRKSCFDIKNIITEFIHNYSTTNDSQIFNVILGRLAAELIAFNLFIEENKDNKINDFCFVEIKNIHLKYEALIKTIGNACPLFEINETLDLDECKQNIFDQYDSWNGRIGEHKVQNVEQSSLLQNNNQSLATLLSIVPVSDNIEDISKKLVDWLKVNTRYKNVSVNDTMDKYGLDSLLGYELICYAEDEFNVILSDDLIGSMPSITTLAKSIQKIQQENKNTNKRNTK